MAIYGFSEEDAKRIGKSVRLVERHVGKDARSGPVNDRGGIGARIMLGTHSSAAWSKNSQKTVTLYGGYPTTANSRPAASAYTVTAHNIFADIAAASGTAVTSRWVAVSCNGFGLYVIAAEC